MKIQSLLLTCLLMSMQAQAQSLKQLIDGSFTGKKDTVIRFEGHTGKHDYIPITIIKGKPTGKVFTIMAGVHGSEYPPIMAAQRAISLLESKDIDGTVIIIPIANVAAFYGRALFYNRRMART